MQRAVVHAQGLGREMVTGGDVLVAVFDENESHAVWLLGEQEMTREYAANLMLHGIVRGASLAKLAQRGLGSHKSEPISEPAPDQVFPVDNCGGPAPRLCFD
jgi:ATP-dependent Clp protease ATP-binding subunit ClpA